MKTILLVCAGALALWGQCGPGQLLAPLPDGGKGCINTSQVVVSAPVAVSALPAASAANVNQILVVNATTNCTTTSGAVPALCMSTGSAWVPVGGGAAAVAAPYSGGLVAEYRLDEQAGRTAFNSVYPHVPTNNLLGYTNIHLSQGAGTVTTAYAPDRNGMLIADRLQLTGSNIEYNSPATSSSLFVSGRQYTLSVDAISNTGVAQTIRMGTIYTGVISGALTVGTAWTRVSYTFTAASNSQYIIVYCDAAGDAVDISYSGLQVDAGAAVTAFQPHIFHAQLGTSPWLTDTSVPSWSTSPWLTFNATTTANGVGDWSPITLANMSTYAVVDQTDDSTSNQFVFGDAGSAWGVQIWANCNTAPDYRIKFGGGAYSCNSSAQANGTIRIADGYPHVLAGTYDGTTIRAYLDGVLVGSTAATVTPQTISTLALGYMYGHYKGGVAYASLYNVAHSASAVAVNTARLVAMMAQRGVTIPAWRNWVMWEGDSITASAYPGMAQLAVTPFPQGVVTAVAGSKVADAVSRESADNAMLQVSPTRNVLVLLLGANDMNDNGGASGFVAALKSYCLAQKAAGWNKIVVLTMLPQTTSGFNTFRDAANALIVADSSFYDAIVRLDQDAIIGCDSCAANTTYYNADGIHPATAGNVIIAADVAAVLPSVLQ